MEYFVAEFKPSFEQHGSVLKFFRSLGDVGDSYFVKAVAFGAELARLKEVDAKQSHRPSTCSVACGPDDALPSLSPLPTPVEPIDTDCTLAQQPPFLSPLPAPFADSVPVVTPTTLDLKPFGGPAEEERRSNNEESTLPATVVEEEREELIEPEQTSVSSHSCTVSSASPTNDWHWMQVDISDDESEERRERKPTRLSTVLQDRKQQPITPGTIQCQLCPTRYSVNGQMPIFNHATSHADEKFDARFCCYKCDFTTKIYSKMVKHGRDTRHLFYDRTTYLSSPEYILHCSSLLSECFPGCDAPKRFLRLVSAAKRVLEGETGEGSGQTPARSDGKVECQMCFMALQRGPSTLFAHATTHMEHEHGARFSCQHCAFLDIKQYKMHDHARREKHALYDKFLEELVRESAATYERCFPGMRHYVRVEQALYRLGSGREGRRASLAATPAPSENASVAMRCDDRDSPKPRPLSTSSPILNKLLPSEPGASSTSTPSDPLKNRPGLDGWLNKASTPAPSRPVLPSKRRLSLPCGGPNRKMSRTPQRDTVECKMCHSLLSHKSLLGHATTHMDAGVYGRRFKCTECGVERASSNLHSCNNSTYPVTDRAQDPRERKYVVECARVFGGCFPGADLPPHLQTTLEEIGGEGVEGEKRHVTDREQTVGGGQSHTHTPASQEREREQQNHSQTGHHIVEIV